MTTTEGRSRSLSEDGAGAVSATETEPLLDTSSSPQRAMLPKKKWHRARPLWYVLVPPLRTVELAD